MKAAKYILSVIFLLFSGLLIFAYFGLLYDKITRPQFKNLDFDSFFLIGLFVLLLIFINYLLIKWLFKNIRKKIT